MRLCCFPLVILVSVLALTGPAQAVVLDLAPSPGSVVVGSPTSVALSISGLTGDLALGTFDMDLTFDPTILSFTGATYGTGLDVLGFGTMQSTTRSVSTRMRHFWTEFSVKRVA
jgi:hypothetical protein